MEWTTVHHLDLRHVVRGLKPLQPHAAVFHPTQAIIVVAIRLSEAQKLQAISHVSLVISSCLPALSRILICNQVAHVLEGLSFSHSLCILQNDDIYNIRIDSWTRTYNWLNSRIPAPYESSPHLRSLSCTEKLHRSKVLSQKAPIITWSLREALRSRKLWKVPSSISCD
ncbi:hypothetical protein KSP40_PGU014486 [Platanthera guangdongensis]|uniref:Maturase n=1 Tax=Platanthera guangdongensis TaxID=2320717 RepID=A0ABR2MQD5_9ASPA